MSSPHSLNRCACLREEWWRRGKETESPAFAAHGLSTTHHLHVIFFCNAPRPRVPISQHPLSSELLGTSSAPRAARGCVYGGWSRGKTTFQASIESLSLPNKGLSNILYWCSLSSKLRSPQSLFLPAINVESFRPTTRISLYIRRSQPVGFTTLFSQWRPSISVFPQIDPSLHQQVLVHLYSRSGNTLWIDIDTITYL